MSRLYQWLNKNFTVQIMFKNRDQVLSGLFEEHCRGEVDIPTELEAVMYEEALFMIQSKFDHKQGITELETLILKSQKSKKKILEITNYDKEVKLEQMKRTWEFTRPMSMFHKLLETFFYMLISNTQNLMYLSFIYSMFQNAGLFGLIYPLSMFGYALMEETRPRKEYWEFIYKYTIVLLTVKFTINLTIFGNMLQNDTFVLVNSYLKIGIYDYQDLAKTFFYMLPEVLILALCILNEIKLKLLGIYYQIE